MAGTSFSDFAGTWRAERGAPYSTHTFTWVAAGDGLRGEWTIEAGGPPADADGPTKLQVQVGTPSLDEGRLLFQVNGGSPVTEFRLVGANEADLGAAVDKLPPEFTGPEYQRSIEGHRIRLSRVK